MDFPAERGNNTHFYKKGKKDETTNTLASILAENGHTESVIEYLKIDIEDHELAAFPDWLVTGALKHVNQVALELHLTKLHEPPK